MLFLLQVVICRNEAEKCLIETSINSLRISLKVNLLSFICEIISFDVLLESSEIGPCPLLI
jgi:hypothetical protein